MLKPIERWRLPLVASMFLAMAVLMVGANIKSNMVIVLALGIEALAVVIGIIRIGLEFLVPSWQLSGEKTRQRDTKGQKP